MLNISLIKLLYFHWKFLVSVMKEFRSRIFRIYKARWATLVRHCSSLDKHKMAFAITLSALIGITPLFGLTFIMATGLGLAFRLNQVIMQSVHMIMSPLQFLLFYPFIKSGELVFGLNSNLNIPVKQIPSYIYNHTQEFFSNYLKIFLAGGLVWIAFSIITGYLLYQLILKYFKLRVEGTA